ncbi:MAG: T9SS type A sorting domain-containing protein [Flavobacteriaceae bacterium]
MAQLFELNPRTGEVLRVVTVENATNTDWEDIAQDESYIYIGDFGNNTGNRTDLGIYRIAKKEFQDSASVLADHITFSFEDQKDFNASQNSDWDAEAFFVFGDHFIVLTKQWQQMGTVAYRIPKGIGHHSAQRMDSYPIAGLVTGATYNETTEKLWLVGYSGLLIPFLAEINDVSDNSIFSGKITKSSLDIGVAQIEAITSYENTYFLTSEEFVNTTPQITSASRLFSFEVEDVDMEKDSLVLFRPGGSPILAYQLDTEDDVFEQAIFDISGRMIAYNPIAILRDGSINVSGWKPSVYFLSFYLKEGKVTKPFIIN